MLSVYPACFFKEKQGYSVDFPDLGAATQGEDLQDAMNMAIDLLAGWIYDAWKENEEVPSPSSIEQIDLAQVWDVEELGPVPEGSFVSMVSVDVKDYAKRVFEKKVNIKVTIPKWLKDHGIEESVNFSAVLTKALKRELHIADSREAINKCKCCDLVEELSYEQCNALYPQLQEIAEVLKNPEEVKLRTDHSRFMKYDGYLGSVEFSAEDNLLYGRIQSINGLVSYEGKSVQELYENFKSAVEDWEDLALALTVEDSEKDDCVSLEDFAKELNIDLEQE